MEEEKIILTEKCFHSGQPIDGPHMGPAPLPWDIAVNPGDKFIKKTVKLEVPHTASVKVLIHKIRCFFNYFSVIKRG